MTWVRILLALFLLLGTVFCITSTVYADDGGGSADGATVSGDGGGSGSSDGTGNSGGGSTDITVIATPNTGGSSTSGSNDVGTTESSSGGDPASLGADPAGDPPADPSLNVGILIQGENPNVNVGVEGDNSQVSVGIEGNNSRVYLNGRSLSSYMSAASTGGGYAGGFVGGTFDEWARNNISKVIFPWIKDAEAKLQLTGDGLAKLILLVQEHTSEISTLTESFDSQGRIASLNEDALEGRVSALESQQPEVQAQIAALRDAYNRGITIIVIVFAFVVAGLGSALVLLWRRRA